MRLYPRYQPGDRIGGRYQVHQVKMGGMGEVYLCLDLETIQPYALKTFRQLYQSAALRNAFEQEVATWVALEKHPNIVHCFYMDILDNQPFMILEWIAGVEGKGPDLRGWLRHGPLDLKTSLEITVDVVCGLIYAQEKQPGLVHRDLKPENILVAQGGLAKITDFGLAQIVESAGLNVEADFDERQSIVGEGGIAGTPAYMAPEQLRGEPLAERTDIYAVGCILYEMLTGQWPFRVKFSPNPPLHFQKWLSEMQSGHETHLPSALPANLPRKVGEVVQSCLAKSSDDRLATLSDFLAQLSALYICQFDQPPPVRTTTAFNAIDYNNRSATYTKLKRYEQALADSNRAIALDSNYASAYINRGVSHHNLKRYEQALANYARAIDLDPNYAHGYHNLGTLYADLGRHDEALSDYNRAIDLDPNYAPAYSSRGTVYADLQRYDEALADSNRAIALDPNYAAAYSGRGNIYTHLQRYDEALSDYNRAIDLDSNLVEAYYNRGTTYLELQRFDEALADYGRAIDLDPNFAKAYYNRGQTYKALQRFDEELTDYGRAIDLDPNFAQAYYNCGTTYQRLQRYKEALTNYDRAIDLDPNYAPAYYNRATTYRKLQRFDEALADYGRAIDLDPNLPQAYFNLGALLANTNQLREALTYFEQAARLGFSQAEQTIAQVRQVLGELVPTLQSDSAQAAFEAFQQVASPDAMRQVVSQYPYLMEREFITDIEKAIAQQVSAEHRPHFEQRLGWLRQIAKEQNL